MLQVEMSASLRSTSGKGAMRRLRMDGMTPAVVYGGGEAALSLQLESKTLMAKLLEFYRHNVVVTLKIDEQTEKSVLVSEVQTHPVNDTLIHVDFLEIDLEKERSFDVSVVLEGKAVGVDLGGVLIENYKSVAIVGKPLDIPDSCILDITNLAIGDNIKVDAISVPASVKMVTAESEVVVSVAKPGVIEVEDDEDGVAVVAEEGAETAE